ncbi:MAG TPA: polyprenyl diphosphate synthase [Candidatus Paceibacterota bacterium]|nr:polyprenyl diphosphate synthase [Candidatus Paceibacterota bacterium]
MTDGPKAIGVILDGNRRWAKERGLPTLEGHKKGLEKVNELMEWAREAGIDELTIYAFSTENWNRAKEEVEYLMQLFERAFTEQFEKVVERGGRVRFIGDRARMPEKLQGMMRDTEDRSAANADGTLIVALSYGGRSEILAAANALLAQGSGSVDEERFKKAMWSAGLLDPELIIRTGGNQRLSNFLTWQSVYSELFFTDTRWPDFSKEEFTAILADYASRERRHGK